MKNLTILLFFCISNFINSQDIEDIKKLDTIYIEYNGEKSISRIIEVKDKNGFTNRIYNFSSLNQNKLNKNVLIFFHKFKNSEKRNINQLSEIKIVNKNFIKKNRSKIIGKSFFSRYESCELEIKVLNDSKVFYLIDNLESKKGKIHLFEVNATVYCVRGE